MLETLLTHFSIICIFQVIIISPDEGRPYSFQLSTRLFRRSLCAMRVCMVHFYWALQTVTNVCLHCTRPTLCTIVRLCKFQKGCLYLNVIFLQLYLYLSPCTCSDKTSVLLFISGSTQTHLYNVLFTIVAIVVLVIDTVCCR